MNYEKWERRIGDRIDQMFDDIVFLARQAEIFATEGHHRKGRLTAAGPHDAIGLHTGASDDASGIDGPSP